MTGSGKSAVRTVGRRPGLRLDTTGERTRPGRLIDDRDWRTMTARASRELRNRVCRSASIRPTQHEPLNLRAGDWVQVKSAKEILATLDQEGRVESLPFMPEMLQYCDRTFQVVKRADKTCDTIESTGLRRMHNAVHLADVRCDGRQHDGCQAGCLLFWKEAWLRRPDAGKSPRVRTVAAGSNGLLDAGSDPPGCPSMPLRSVMTATRSSNVAGELTYMCQATELRAATSALPWWYVSQYVRDVRSGNATVAQVLRGALIGLFNRTQVLLRRVVPASVLVRDGLKYPFIQGVLTRTPTEVIGLQPGDVVEIKSKEEIVATLDTNNRNRGLLFDREEVRFCGRRARVLRRVNKVIDERTGKMIHIDSDSVILEGVYCGGEFNRCCPRGIYSFWREIWLKKAGEPCHGPSQPHGTEHA